MKLNLVDHYKVTPAVLMDTSVEFFIHEEKLYCVTDGQRYSFENFPVWVIETMNLDMEANPIAIECLIDWGLEETEPQMKQYIACRHGGYDDRPDISADGHVQTSEYVCCGKRGECKYEGRLCTSFQLRFGTLTRSEIAVLVEIGNFLLDKEIAEKLNISEHTVRHHKDSICRKSGLERKPALVGLAFKLGLITC
ncbi:helix-turn-helix transcriptional regulator [Pedobacter sp. Hv1]|uniref:helix-turn-helix transcriptional regulator n=1 Tax=Pedobacter sp. Hv1 TaxID=1740090 RepID=UPI0006D895F4|nr:helix-turn-helix transcriptional regulator [Pedobacter sp. Hv1]KQC02059.1 hypothetical protein AQF98_00355 [Pedobacter sp. Hv1]